MKRLSTVIVFVIGAQSFAWGYQNPTSWRLSTDDTTIVVAVQQGIPAVTQLRSTKSDSNWLLAPAPEVLPSSVSQQNAAVATKWQYDGGALDPQSGELVLRFSNPAPALELQSIWRARPGHGPIEHWLTIANHSGAVITLGHQDSLVLSNVAIPKNESMDAWWIKRGAGNATTEGGTILQSIGRNSGETLTSDPTDGASPVPWLALAGWHVARAVCWVGIFRHRTNSYHSEHEGDSDNRPPVLPSWELTSGICRCSRQMSLRAKHSSFRRPLSAATPAISTMVAIPCTASSWKNWCRNFLQGYEHPTLAYNLYLDGGGANADEKGVLQSAALAKELGFETFVVDAMWFPQSGDWRWDPKRFPHGSQPIEEYVHQQWYEVWALDGLYARFTMRTIPGR